MMTIDYWFNFKSNGKKRFNTDNDKAYLREEDQW